MELEEEGASAVVLVAPVATMERAQVAVTKAAEGFLVATVTALGVARMGSETVAVRTAKAVCDRIPLGLVKAGVYVATATRWAAVTTPRIDVA